MSIVYEDLSLERNERIVRAQFDEFEWAEMQNDERRCLENERWID